MHGTKVDFHFALQKAKSYKVFLIFLVCSSIFRLQGQDRNGKDFALFFGVKEYEEQVLQGLNNPIRDVEALASLLHEKFNFMSVIYRNSDKDEIEQVLQEWQEKTFPENSQLFVFFSGHGVLRELSGNGYFIPSDGIAEKFSTHLQLRELGNIVSKIPCRHILLAIDACYSGTIDPVTASRGLDGALGRPEEKNNLDIIIEKQLEFKSRLWITSGGKERTPDGRDHSPFSAAIMKSLKEAYTSEEGVLMFQDLISGLSRVFPIPRKGELADHDGGGFVFISKNYLPKARDRSRIEGDKLIDLRDDTEYRLLRLHNQIWMAQNMNFAGEFPSASCYENLPSNCGIYGRLYNWEDAYLVCAGLGEGWRLPTLSDWNYLKQFYGDKTFEYLVPGPNSIGLDLQFGGVKEEGIEFKYLFHIGSYWAREEYNEDEAWIFYLSHKLKVFSSYHFLKSELRSCRCIKDM